MSEPISEERRKQAFADVVAAQDEGLSVPAARARVAEQYELAAETVKDIEREGIEHNWPPLGE
jgi:hypothetical protein